ncbi:MAG TPA: hypothetical protein VGC04_07055 [Cellulomonas sp.]
MFMMGDMMMSGTMPMAGLDAMDGMDMDKIQKCMEACSACEQACTMCADMAGDGMRMSMSMCLDCADMANTMMRMMLRPMGMHTPSMMAMCQAMITMAKACADECMKHADTMPTMAMCAQACTECASACEAMMAA